MVSDNHLQIENNTENTMTKNGKANGLGNEKDKRKRVGRSAGGSAASVVPVSVGLLEVGQTAGSRGACVRSPPRMVRAVVPVRRRTA